MPEVKVDPMYNPFNQGSTWTDTSSQSKPSVENWEELYRPGGAVARQNLESDVNQSQLELDETDDQSRQTRRPIQIHRRFIISQIKSGLIIIDQQNASERTLYERYLLALKNSKAAVQKSLFSKTITMSPGDFELVKEMKDELNALGFEIREFGKNTVVIEGVPADSVEKDAEALLERILEMYKDNVLDLKLEKHDNLARSLAKSLCIKSGRVLKEEEMTVMIDKLFACSMPYYTPNGNPTITTLTNEELNAKFGK
jgi:DNA mismatch repair protein MutL